MRRRRRGGGGGGGGGGSSTSSTEAQKAVLFPVALLSFVTPVPPSLSLFLLSPPKPPPPLADTSTNTFFACFLGPLHCLPCPPFLCLLLRCCPCLLKKTLPPSLCFPKTELLGTPDPCLRLCLGLLVSPFLVPVCHFVVVGLLRVTFRPAAASNTYAPGLFPSPPFLLTPWCPRPNCSLPCPAGLLALARLPFLAFGCASGNTPLAPFWPRQAGATPVRGTPPVPDRRSGAPNPPSVCAVSSQLPPNTVTVGGGVCCQPPGLPPPGTCRGARRAGISYPGSRVQPVPRYRRPATRGVTPPTGAVYRGPAPPRTLLAPAPPSSPVPCPVRRPSLASAPPRCNAPAPGPVPVAATPSAPPCLAGPCPRTGVALPRQEGYAGCYIINILLRCAHPGLPPSDRCPRAPGPGTPLESNILSVRGGRFGRLQPRCRVDAPAVSSGTTPAASGLFGRRRPSTPRNTHASGARAVHGRNQAYTVTHLFTPRTRPRDGRPRAPPRSTRLPPGIIIRGTASSDPVPYPPGNLPQEPAPPGGPRVLRLSSLFSFPPVAPAGCRPPRGATAARPGRLRHGTVAPRQPPNTDVPPLARTPLLSRRLWGTTGAPLRNPWPTPPAQRSPRPDGGDRPRCTDRNLRDPRFGYPLPHRFPVGTRPHSVTNRLSPPCKPGPRLVRVHRPGRRSPAFFPSRGVAGPPTACGNGRSGPASWWGAASHPLTPFSPAPPPGTPPCSLSMSTLFLLLALSRPPWSPTYLSLPTPFPLFPPLQTPGSDCNFTVPLVRTSNPLSTCSNLDFPACLHRSSCASHLGPPLTPGGGVLKYCLSLLYWTPFPSGPDFLLLLFFPFTCCQLSSLLRLLLLYFFYTSHPPLLLYGLLTPWLPGCPPAPLVAPHSTPAFLPAVRSVPTPLPHTFFLFQPTPDHLILVPGCPLKLPLAYYLPLPPSLLYLPPSAVTPCSPPLLKTPFTPPPCLPSPHLHYLPKNPTPSCPTPLPACPASPSNFVSFTSVSCFPGHLRLPACFVSCFWRCLCCRLDPPLPPPSISHPYPPSRAVAIPSHSAAVGRTLNKNRAPHLPVPVPPQTDAPTLCLPLTGGPPLTLLSLGDRLRRRPRPGAPGVNAAGAVGARAARTACRRAPVKKTPPGPGAVVLLGLAKKLTEHPAISKRWFDPGPVSPRVHPGPSAQYIIHPPPGATQPSRKHASIPGTPKTPEPGLMRRSWTPGSARRTSLVLLPYCYLPGPLPLRPPRLNPGSSHPLLSCTVLYPACLAVPYYYLCNLSLVSPTLFLPPSPLPPAAPFPLPCSAELPTPAYLLHTPSLPPSPPFLSTSCLPPTPCWPLCLPRCWPLLACRLDPYPSPWQRLTPGALRHAPCTAHRRRSVPLVLGPLAADRPPRPSRNAFSRGPRAGGGSGERRADWTWLGVARPSHNVNYLRFPAPPVSAPPRGPPALRLLQPPCRYDPTQPSSGGPSLYSGRQGRCPPPLPLLCPACSLLAWRRSLASEVCRAKEDPRRARFYLAITARRQSGGTVHNRPPSVVRRPQPGGQVRGRPPGRGRYGERVPGTVNGAFGPGGPRLQPLPARSRIGPRTGRPAAALDVQHRTARSGQSSPGGAETVVVVSASGRRGLTVRPAPSISSAPPVLSPPGPREFPDAGNFNREVTGPSTSAAGWEDAAAFLQAAIIPQNRPAVRGSDYGLIPDDVGAFAPQQRLWPRGAPPGIANPGRCRRPGPAGVGNQDRRPVTPGGSPSPPDGRVRVLSPRPRTRSWPGPRGIGTFPAVGLSTKDPRRTDSCAVHRRHRGGSAEPAPRATCASPVRKPLETIRRPTLPPRTPTPGARIISNPGVPRAHRPPASGRSPGPAQPPRLGARGVGPEPYAPRPRGGSGHPLKSPGGRLRGGPRPSTASNPLAVRGETPLAPVLRTRAGARTRRLPGASAWGTVAPAVSPVTTARGRRGWRHGRVHAGTGEPTASKEAGPSNKLNPGPPTLTFLATSPPLCAGTLSTVPGLGVGYRVPATVASGLPP
uniref:Uncharacterized protein n=1 Tax=Knipowitschia caucasica TaxID=637954 RepID=A0AAV2L8H4_KNICA